MMTWYTGDPTYDTVLTFSFVLVALVFIGGAFVKSPYGRFASDGFGINLSPRLGWFLISYATAGLSIVSAKHSIPTWPDAIPLHQPSVQNAWDPFPWQRQYHL